MASHLRRPHARSACRGRSAWRLVGPLATSIAICVTADFMACDSIPPVAFGNEGVAPVRTVVHPATIAAGQSFSLGATVCPGGVNFSVFSRRATLIELLLFDSDAD